MKTRELIKAIVDYHPSSDAGIKRGWSEYMGGMKDSGSWNVLKMLDATDEELQQCLDELAEEWKPEPPKVYTEEEKMQQKNIIRHEVDGHYFYTNEYTENQFKELARVRALRLITG